MIKEAELAKLWERIPGIKCKGKCADSCGPIAMSTAEYENLRAHAGERIQAAPVAPGNVMVTNCDKKTFRCPLLQNERCSRYEQRPLVCRLFGVVKAMRCPFGCVPDRWLRDVDAAELLRQASNL